MPPELENDASLRNVLSESQEMNIEAYWGTKILSYLVFCTIFSPKEEPEVLDQVEL